MCGSITNCVSPCIAPLIARRHSKHVCFDRNLRPSMCVSIANCTQACVFRSQIASKHVFRSQIAPVHVCFESQIVYVLHHSCNRECPTAGNARCAFEAFAAEVEKADQNVAQRVDQGAAPGAQVWLSARPCLFLGLVSFRLVSVIHVLLRRVSLCLVSFPRQHPTSMK